MKIKASSGSRILFEGEDMFLTEYCDDSNMWFWKIIGEKFFLIEKGFKEQGTLYTLSFPQKRKYSYSAYESRMYCIYLGYKYDIENIWHELFILYPNERKTRRHLKLNDHDDSRIEVPYEEFIASSPIIGEERKPISDFVFDVEPLVYLFKDNSYIEERTCMVHGITEYQMREMNNGNIPYRSIAVLLFTVLLSSCLKETAVPIESTFTIETSEDKTSSVPIQLKNGSYGTDEYDLHVVFLTLEKAEHRNL